MTATAHDRDGSWPRQLGARSRQLQERQLSAKSTTATRRAFYVTPPIDGPHERSHFRDRRRTLVGVIVALVLLSAFLHALWNALLRLERDKDRGLVAAVAVAMCIAIAVAGCRWWRGDVPFPT